VELPMSSIGSDTSAAINERLSSCSQSSRGRQRDRARMKSLLEPRRRCRDRFLLLPQATIVRMTCPGQAKRGFPAPSERDTWVATTEIPGPPGPRALSQEMLQSLKVARHAPIDQHDSHARIDGKPAVRADGRSHDQTACGGSVPGAAKSASSERRRGFGSRARHGSRKPEPTPGRRRRRESRMPAASVRRRAWAAPSRGDG
jgi:uncharacterized Zn-binding protein involved in type VI secretion